MSVPASSRVVRRATRTPHRPRPRHGRGTRLPRRPLHRRHQLHRRLQLRRCRCHSLELGCVHRGPWVCPLQPTIRRTWLVNKVGARAVGEHLPWQKQADSEEREVREERVEQGVQGEQEEQGVQGDPVALEALVAHGYTTRLR
ncbi:unnamed protein product [Closterium sp. NIES-53]